MTEKLYNSPFKSLIATLETLKDFTRDHILELWREWYSDQITFAFLSFSWDEEKKKVNKKPLLKKSWKTEITSEDVKLWLKRIAKEYSRGSYRAGIALRAEDWNIHMIDIDDKTRFGNYFDIKKFLEDIKKDAYLIVKTPRGYHIYLNPELIHSPREVSNRDLLENFGFEVKNSGLITFFPSAYQRQDGELLTYSLIHTDPGNLEKTQTESDSLKKLKQLVENLDAEKKNRLDEIKQKIEETRRKFAEKRKGFAHLKDVIEEIKRKIRFYDLIPDNFAKHCGHYDLYHCPFHQPDKNPSFAVYHDRDHEFGYDFHDNQGYDVITFYQEYHQTDFKTALRELCKIAGTPYPEKVPERNIKFEDHEKEIETDRAFYTKPFFISNKNRKAKRYAMIKQEKEIWEVEEETKIMKPEEEYLEDQEKALEVIPIEEIEISTKNGIQKKYSYRVFYKKTEIAGFIIKEGILYINPLNEEERYALCLETSTGRQIKLNEITFEHFYDFIKKGGLSSCSLKIRDALSKCLNAMMTAGIIKQKIEIPTPGFYLLNGELVFAKLEEKEQINKKQLKNSLLFLNKLVENHYAHIKEKFATIIKWFITAPFSFVARQQGEMLRGLYLYGTTGTGKSTMCILGSLIWKNCCRRKTKNNDEETGGAIDTMARLGSCISESTFPVIISEPKGALQKEEIMEGIKNAMTNIIVRKRYINQKYTEILALSNMAFTSNHFVPEDDSFLRRFLVISFNPSEKPDTKKKKAFRSIEKQAQKLLPVLGITLVSCIKNSENLKEKILSLSEENQFEVAEDILKFLYRTAELEPPEWISLKYETEYSPEDYEKEKKFLIISSLKDYIYKEIEKASRLIPEDLESVRERFEHLLLLQKFSFLVVKNDTIYLTTKVLEVVNPHQVQVVPNLKVFAELLGYPYQKKSFRFGSSVTTLRIIPVPRYEFINLLFPPDDNIDIEDVVEDEKEYEKDPLNINKVESDTERKCEYCEYFLQSDDNLHGFCTFLEKNTYANSTACGHFEPVIVF